MTHRIACFCGAMFETSDPLDICPNCRTPVTPIATPDTVDVRAWAEELHEQIEDWGVVAENCE